MVPGKLRFRKTALAGLAAGWLILRAATPGAESAHRKFALLDAAKLPAGSRVRLTAAEIGAWATDEAKLYAPGATRNIRLVLRNGEATGSLSVDFLKLQEASTGEQAGWLMRNLFSGEKQVTVRARVESRDRRARVDVERVEISGVVIQGATLDFLIRNWVRPTFPDVRINDWFPLGFRIDRFTLTPGAVSVYIGK